MSNDAVSQKLEQSVLANRFVDTLRCDRRIDEDDVAALERDLVELGSALHGAEVMSRALASYLHHGIQIVHDMVIRVADDAETHPSAANIAFAARLEEIWIRLDALVTECFEDRP